MVNETPGDTAAPTRENIVRALVNALEPLDFVYALWEGGAVAFDRVDQWSDIDICVDAKDDRVEDALPVAEQALKTLAPIALKYDVDFPKLGDYVQAFYRLKGTTKFMVVDLAVFRHSAPDKLLEPEIHGRSKFHFNKGNAVTIPRLDPSQFLGKLRNRVGSMRRRFAMFGCFVEKEILREHWIEAIHFYHRFTLGLLAELLRIHYNPVRHDFATRYVYYDLPRPVVERLEDLYFVKDTGDLRIKYRMAEKWILEVIEQLDFERIEQALAKGG
jgi:hypothetical protein